MQSLAGRIEQLISESGRSVRAYATLIGVPPQKIYDILRGKTQKCPKDLCEAISAQDKTINVEWLLSGKGKMYNDGAATAFGEKPEGIWIPPELAKMFSDMAATIRSQQEDLHELRASSLPDNKKTAAGL